MNSSLGKSLFAALAVIVISLGMTSAAEALAPPYPYDCNSPGPTYTKADGTTFVTGTTSSCGDNPQNTLVTITKLKPDGSIDPAFSDGVNPGGTVILNYPTEGTKPVAIAPSPSGGYILVTDKAILRIQEQGRLDAGTFGFFGYTDAIDTNILHHPITAGAVADDGSIYVVGGGSGAGLALAKFDKDGHIDTGFGTSGVKSFTTPPGKTLAAVGGLDVDALGRIVLGGVGYDRISAMRLLANGSPDSAFGPGNDGFSEGPVEGNFAKFSRMYVDDSGAIRIYASGTPVLYFFKGFEASFNAAGALVNSFGISNWGSGALAETPGGGLVTSIGPGRGDSPTFNLSKSYPGGSGGFNRTEYDISPGRNSVDSAEYVPSSDSVVAAGSAGGPLCASLCTDQSFIAVLKVDAATGEPDPGFGVNGVALVPGNKCNYGVGFSADVPKLAWNRCRVKSPETSMSARFIHPHTKRAELAGLVRISGPQEKPGYMRSKTTIKLPRSMRYRRGMLEEKTTIKVTVSGKTSVVPTKLSFERRQARFTVTLAPDTSDFIPYHEDEPANLPATIHFRVKPGAIKPVAKPFGIFGRMMGASSIYMPVDLYADPVYPSKWFGNSENANANFSLKVR